MGWKVFLPDRYIKPVEHKIHQISESLIDSVPAEGGLMGGKAGLALAFSYYAHWTRSQSFLELAEDLMEKAINPLNGPFPVLSLANGLGGIAWTLDHLNTERLLNLDGEKIYKELDEHLYHFMLNEMRIGHYDYLHGSLGMALFFLRDPGNSKYRTYLEEVLVELETCSQNEPDGGIKWESVLDHNDGKRGYNLSLSHGLSSIMILLSRLYEAGLSKAVIERLLIGSLKYLDKQKLPPGKNISLFPSWALESTSQLEESRLAWCYGDIGIGLAYRTAAKQLMDRKAELHGEMILLNSARRRDPGENRVYDANICHGTSGLALIFNILYQQSGLTDYREAALHWLDVCLNMASHSDGIAGYKTWHLPEYGGWKNIPGLLDGAAGIGLSLLSFVSDREPSWAKSLLLI